MWRGTKLAFGGCVVLPVLLAIGFVGCLALFAGGGGQGGSGESRERKAQQAAADIGQPVHVGGVTWTLSLIDSSGNKSEVDPDYFSYVPTSKEIFLENVNPGVTRPGEVIFTVAPRPQVSTFMWGTPTR